jgi:hypothetical protein
MRHWVKSPALLKKQNKTKQNPVAIKKKKPFINVTVGWVLWDTLIITSLGRLGQKDLEFKINLDYTARP